MEKIRSPESEELTLRSEDGVPRLKLAFVCNGDPNDIQTWSGIPYHMLQALRSEFDVIYVERNPWPTWFSFPCRVLRRLTGWSIDPYWSEFWTKLASRAAIARIESSRPDLVFTVAVTPICAALVDNGRTIFVSDATQAKVMGEHPWYNPLTPGLKRSAARMEDRAIQRSVMSYFPSSWAYQSALTDHGGDPDRIFQVPWGSNLPGESVSAPEDRVLDEWRLLWVGKEWDRKGGDIVLDCVAELRARGHRVHVDMVGSLPSPPEEAPAGVTFHGFLDKNSPADLAKIEELYTAAHVFFLPTRFEPLGIVFVEAASYALPSVAYRTGGVPSVVVDGKTGVLVDEGEPPEAFADAIEGLMADQERYVRICKNAQSRARERFNWQAWAAEVRRNAEAWWKNRQVEAAQDDSSAKSHHDEAQTVLLRQVGSSGG